MDIDIDWCLTCEKRIAPNNIYCSPECQSHAAPLPLDQQRHEQEQQQSSEDGDDDEHDDDLMSHNEEDSLQSTWIEDWEQRIQVWAAQIPPGPPPGEIDFDNSPKTPSLLKSHRTVLPPTLAMSTPYQASAQTQQYPSSASAPLVTPKRHTSVNSIAAQYASMGDTSAATTESSIATPASAHNIPSRKASMLNLVYDQVRSWVTPSPIALSSQQHLKSLYQQHPPTDKERLTIRPSVLTIPHELPRNPHVLSDQTTVCWVAGTVMLDAKPSRSFNEYAISSSPSPKEDYHPSFRTRGRKASRAAA